MSAFAPRFTITNRITTDLTVIECARGFLEAATLSADWVRRMSQRALLVEALSEQRRIVDIFDKADAIRRKRREAIALTEDLLRSAFLEMFGDPVTNPKGWRTVPLDELIDQERGISYEVVQRSGLKLKEGCRL